MDYPFHRFLNSHFNVPIVGAEIGVFHGANALYMFEHLDMAKLYLVDPWMDENNMQGYTEGATVNKFPIAVESLKDYWNKCLFMRMTSVEASELVNEKLDLVYIDGNHEKEFVYEDIIVWERKIRKGGIIAGHDWVSHPSVKEAVLEYVKLAGVENLCTSDWKSGYWWWEIQ